MRTRSWALITWALIVGGWACTARNPAFRDPPVPAVDAAAALVAPDAMVSPDMAAAQPDLGRPEDASPPDVSVSPDAAADMMADNKAAQPGMALLVVGDVNLSKSDSQLMATLLIMGLTPVLVDGQEVTAADATGKVVVIISGSSWSDDVGGTFRDVTVPVVVFDEAIYGAMNMTGTRVGTDSDSFDDTRLTILTPGHPLAAGLTGTVTVSDATIQISWGVPASSAARVASVVGQSTHVAIFGYDAGAMMVNLRAPAKRVGAFVRYPNDAIFTEPGLQLFSAAVRWATSP